MTIKSDGVRRAMPTFCQNVLYNGIVGVGTYYVAGSYDGVAVTTTPTSRSDPRNRTQSFDG